MTNTRQRKMDVYKGTELKLAINIDQIDGLSPDVYDFSVDFYTRKNKQITIHKSEMIYDDSGVYVALILTEHLEILGRGRLMGFITAYIPDADFPDGLRTETLEVETGLELK